MHLAPGDCSGPRLALALDRPGGDVRNDPGANDALCINKELVEKVGAVTVGMTHMGLWSNRNPPAERQRQRRRLLILLQRLRQFSGADKVEAAGQPRKPLQRKCSKRTIGGVPVAQKRFREKSPNEDFPRHLAFVHYLLKKTDMAFPAFVVSLFVIIPEEQPCLISEQPHELEGMFADKEKRLSRVSRRWRLTRPAPRSVG